MADLDAAYRHMLKQAFASRKERNPRYSLRGFARFLGVDPTFLSKLISGKLLLSLDQADKITRKLNLAKSDRATFLLSAAEEQKCHALYLIDPSLTECDPTLDRSNQAPRRKRTK